jgi:hypothetical protein
MYDGGDENHQVLESNGRNEVLANKERKRERNEQRKYTFDRWFKKDVADTQIRYLSSCRLWTLQSKEYPTL